MNNREKYFEELGTDFLPIPKAIMEDYNGLTKNAKDMYIELLYRWLICGGNIEKMVQRILDIGTEDEVKAINLLFESGYICEDTYILKAKSNKKYNTHEGVFQTIEK